MNALVAGNGSYILRPCGHDLHGPTVSLSCPGGVPAPHKPLDMGLTAPPPKKKQKPNGVIDHLVSDLHLNSMLHTFIHYVAHFLIEARRKVYHTIGGWIM